MRRAKKSRDKILTTGQLCVCLYWSVWTVLYPSSMWHKPFSFLPFPNAGRQTRKTQSEAHKASKSATSIATLAAPISLSLFRFFALHSSSFQKTFDPKSSKKVTLQRESEWRQEKHEEKKRHTQETSRVQDLHFFSAFPLRKIKKRKRKKKYENFVPVIPDLLSLFHSLSISI